MKVTKKVNARGEYAKLNEDIKDGQTIKILEDCVIVTGEFGDKHVFKVETPNGEKNLTFNQTSMNNLIDAFGDETESWVGIEVKAWLITQSIGGQMRRVCYLTAPEWVMEEDAKGSLVFAPRSL